MDCGEGLLNWNVPQVVRFRFDDNVSGNPELMDLVDIQHSVKNSDAFTSSTITGVVLSSSNELGDPTFDGDDRGTLTAKLLPFAGFEPPFFAEGLRGRSIEISGSLVDNNDAIGQRRVILSNTDNELVLPVDTHVRFDVTAVDVLHSFWIPAFRTKIDAVPGLTTTLHANITETGDYKDDINFRVQCAELCGRDHSIMMSPVRVVERDEFNEWVLSRQN